MTNHFLTFHDRGTADVAEMHEKFRFTLNTAPTDLRPEVHRQRHRFMEEEMNELANAIQSGDTLEIIDALVDIVYIAKGTAVMMGIDWGAHWKEVHQANMSKERGFNPKRPGQEEDLIKPEGWQAPDHGKVLKLYAG